ARSRSVMSSEGAGTRPASPSPPERPQKLGWLKKQRSIVKNWQQRYFVLKGQQLYYYKDEDEVKPQRRRKGGCDLPPPAPCTSDPRMVLFAGASGEHSWAGQDSCVLMASTQAEMEEWVKSIRRAQGSSSGGKLPSAVLLCPPDLSVLSPAVFGQHLAETMAQEQKFGQQQQVPILVQKCAEFILQQGLSEEGIFRLPGQDNLVKQLREAFDAGERPSFGRDTDVHTVASLLKLYLRELPEPVVPWLQYEEFLLCGQVLDTDRSKGHQELLKQLSLLPRDNYNLLSYICRFLHEIQLNSSVNKMSVDNLATVIGVNLIRPQIEDPATIMRGTPRIQKVMTVMISDHAELFPPSKDEPLSPAAPQQEKRAPVPRSSVGWGAAEEPAVPRAESSIQRQTGAEPSSRSVPAAAASSNVPGEESRSRDSLGLWKMQPRKRTQTLPSRNTLLAAASAGQKGSSNKAEGCRSCPSSSVHSALPEGHKRTLSHDLFKLLDFHRTPTHDRSPPAPRAESAEGSSSSPSPSSSDQEFLPCPSPQPKEMASPTSSPTEASKPDQESREVLQSIILKLEKEKEAQKNHYEEQIRSLEKENYEVWARVVRLNQEIERERKKCAELELRLLGMESSGEDVERTNKRLEEEVQKLSK
ncbi:RHG25 protein, partial [Psilopogon haemacephalus]|nr:RHG25 protein [Psilopogon haemacephalus]